MLSKELLEKVKALGEGDKLQLVQLLIDELKLVGNAYEIFTPFGNEAAARRLLDSLPEIETPGQPEIE